MGRINLKERIKQGVFLLDGAMGTQLIARGIEPGRCSDYLSIDSPDTIFDIHRGYLDAGSDAVSTNTFGANKYALNRHGLSDKVEAINKAGAELARRAAGQDRYVLGDIGPSGDFLEPLGTLKADELKAAFTEQAKALLDGGVDALLIETMTALDEMVIAIEAVKSVCDLPVFASLAFDKAGEDYRTMMGLDVDSAVSKIVSLGVDVVGFNCGKMPLDDYVDLAVKYISSAAGQEIAILAEPNAGIPELVEDRAIYNVSPEDFAQVAQKIHSAGVRIIGGCCGTEPKHIEAVAKSLKK